MSRALRRVVPCLLALGLAPPPRGGADEAGERTLQAETEAALRQVMEIERAVEMGKRLVPPADMWEDDVANLMRRARAAGLEDVRPSPVTRVPFPSTSGGPLPLELRRVPLSGRAPYEAVHRFLSLLAAGPRRVDVEEVRLAAAPEGAVDFAIQLGLPVHTGDAAMPPPSPPRVDTGGARTPEEARAAARESVLRARLLDVRARLEALQALHRVLARYEERAARGHALAALGRFHSAMGDSTIAIAEARLAEGLTLEGVVVGAAARARLKPALESAGLGGEITLRALGACHRFSLTAEVKAEAIEDARAAGNGPFDAGTAAACAAPPRPGLGRVATRGSDPNGITLRLRDVEAADLFRVLNELTGEGFVVDGDVEGRLDVHLEQAPLADALAALKPAGLVAHRGALVRVSLAGAAVTEPRLQDYTGEAVSVSLKEADLRDVLGLFETISGLTFEAPQGFEGRVSVFAREAAWDRIFDAVFHAAGLTYRIDGARVILSPGPGAPPPGAVRPRGNFPRTPGQVGIDDLRPLGAGLAGGRWQAYAYSPGQVLWTLAPGQSFLDGAVKSVTRTAVSFDVGGRPVDKPLP